MTHPQASPLSAPGALEESGRRHDRPCFTALPAPSVAARRGPGVQVPRSGQADPEPRPPRGWACVRNLSSPIAFASPILLFHPACSRTPADRNRLSVPATWKLAAETGVPGPLSPLTDAAHRPSPSAPWGSDRSCLHLSRRLSPWPGAASRSCRHRSTSPPAPQTSLYPPECRGY